MLIPIWLPCYGDLNFRGKCPTEAVEQTTFFNQVRKRWPDTIGAIAIHPRNEGKRTHAQTARHKAEGLVSGASDVIIPGAPAFVLELKRQDHTKSTWQSGQLPYLEACHSMGAFVCVAFGWEAAMQAVEEWYEAQR